MATGGVGLDGCTSGSEAGEGGAQGYTEGEVRVSGSGGGEARHPGEGGNPGTDVEPHLAEGAIVAGIVM